jgi:hypothetical protein
LFAPGTQQTELEDMEERTTDSLLYIPFNPDRPPEHKTFLERYFAHQLEMID